MSKVVETSANEAVFFLQLNSKEAANYVCRNANVDREAAVQAVKQVMVFHRKG